MGSSEGSSAETRVVLFQGIEFNKPTPKQYQHRSNQSGIIPKRPMNSETTLSEDYTEVADSSAIDTLDSGTKTSLVSVADGSRLIKGLDDGDTEMSGEAQIRPGPDGVNGPQETTQDLAPTSSSETLHRSLKADGLKEMAHANGESNSQVAKAPSAQSLGGSDRMLLTSNTRLAMDNAACDGHLTETDTHEGVASEEHVAQPLTWSVLDDESHTHISSDAPASKPDTETDIKGLAQSSLAHLEPTNEVSLPDQDLSIPVEYRESSAASAKTGPKTPGAKVPRSASSQINLRAGSRPPSNSRKDVPKSPSPASLAKPAKLMNGSRQNLTGSRQNLANGRSTNLLRSSSKSFIPTSKPGTSSSNVLISNSKPGTRERTAQMSSSKLSVPIPKDALDADPDVRKEEKTLPSASTRNQSRNSSSKPPLAPATPKPKTRQNSRTSQELLNQSPVKTSPLRKNSSGDLLLKEGNPQTKSVAEALAPSEPPLADKAEDLEQIKTKSQNISHTPEPTSSNVLVEGAATLDPKGITALKDSEYEDDTDAYDNGEGTDPIETVAPKDNQHELAENAPADVTTVEAPESVEQRPALNSSDDLDTDLSQYVDTRGSTADTLMDVLRGLEKQIDQLNDEKAFCIAQIATLESEQQLNLSNVAHLTSTNEQVTNDLTTAQREKEALFQQVQDLTKTLQYLQGRLEAAESKAALVAERPKSAGKSAELMVKLTLAEERIAKLQKENDTLRTQKLQLLDKALDLKMKLKNQTELPLPPKMAIKGGKVAISQRYKKLPDIGAV
ncbi:hypothetical protein DFS34DRAFT_592339 [Phlyctochytrium arcticum]|nr:hypothetical protein DFS34DRAFT_592339 [Phlyctochytrium arcticum]